MEIGDGGRAERDLPDGHKFAENRIIDELDLKIQHENTRQHAQNDAARPFGQQRHEREQGKARCQREQQRVDDARRHAAVHEQVQRQLQIHRQQQARGKRRQDGLVKTQLLHSSMIPRFVRILHEFYTLCNTTAVFFRRGREEIYKFPAACYTGCNDTRKIYIEWSVLL